MTDKEVKYHRKEIATAQLKTAVILFLNSMDLSSVITLAGAAGNILSQLARNAGKEPFIDYACKVHNHFKGSTPARIKYNHYIDRYLGISVHKHMSNSCPETVNLDLKQCAEDALVRAISDYVALYGQGEGFVRSFLNWAWHNKDGKKAMEKYKDIPEVLKK